MAAIFDLRHTQTSDSIPTSLSVLPDPKNMGIAVGILLLSCIEAQIFYVRLWIHVFPVWPPPSWISEWYRRVLPLTKTSLSSPNTKQHTTLFYSAKYHVYQGCLLRATILLIIDEFHLSKLLIWRHAFWGHVMLRSWNQCCPVENSFVYKVIKHFCHISSDKNVTQQRVLWGIPPICNTRIKAIFCKKPAVQTFMGRNLAVFGPEIPHSEFEGTKPSNGTCINRNTTFEPLSMQFWPKLRPLGWPRKHKKETRREKKVKTVIFHYLVETPFCNRSAPNLVSL